MDGHDPDARRPGLTVSSVDSVLVAHSGGRHMEIAALIARRASSRIGWYLDGKVIEMELGIADIDHAAVVNGQLGAQIRIEDEPGGVFHWKAGTLSLWNRKAVLPATLLQGVVGEPLERIATHRLLRPGMTVKAVGRSDMWTRLTVDGWCDPMEPAVTIGRS